ncbi:MAG: hypothetical protein SFX74_03500 [Fimbriimonadaceae bacterium]|nr:hypothetical protein [Fimbriimonadaceae bacterium]
MGRIATAIARWIWGGMLWFMRRPVLKRARRNAVKILPESLRERAQRSIHAQDRFARRYGIRMLAAVIQLCAVSMLFSITMTLVLIALQNGWLSAPDPTQAAPIEAPNAHGAGDAA